MGMAQVHIEILTYHFLAAELHVPVRVLRIVGAHEDLWLIQLLNQWMLLMIVLSRLWRHCFDILLGLL